MVLPTFIRLKKPLLARGFMRWAVTGSNRRPLRCKRGAEQTSYLRNRSFYLFRAAFERVPRCRGVAWYLRSSAEQKRNKASTKVM
jgi:hypothetical protein